MSIIYFILLFVIDILFTKYVAFNWNLNFFMFFMTFVYSIVIPGLYIILNSYVYKKNKIQILFYILSIFPVYISLDKCYFDSTSAEAPELAYAILANIPRFMIFITGIILYFIGLKKKNDS